jgi:hypothetical protein
VSRRSELKRAGRGGEELRLLSCEGKIGYDSAAQAAQVAGRVLQRPRRSEKNRPGRAPSASIYYCGFCGKHHWGHPPHWKTKQAHAWK